MSTNHKQGINLSQNCYTHRVWTACTATVLSMCSMAVHADSPDRAVPQQIVRFADLNLSGPQGAEALYARIRSAANQVCGPQNDRDLTISGIHRACMNTAIADAVAHVGNAQLRAVYEAHQGHTQAVRTAAVAQR